MFKPLVYCAKCLRYLRESDLPEVDYDDYEGAIEWIPACDWCLKRMAGQGRIAGTQPAVCLECRAPFQATRAAQKFCSSSCRARSWRAARPTERLRSR